LLQISQTSGIPLADIHFLASHLIYWRRARAVPPLHQRDIYIVSPNADMRKLRSATQQYAKLFPAQLPSLPKMLSLLSAGPRPFNTLIPSKDHKAVYFDVLAWLLRGGWVTQLRTFGWVRVPATIQAGVAREEAELAAEVGRKDTGEARASFYAESAFIDTASSSSTGSDDPGPPDLPAGTLSPPFSQSRSRTSSLSSARTAIPVISEAMAKDRAVAAPVEAFAPLLLLAPTKASGRESRYLAHIARAMEVSEGREVRECWERCLKYFNGEHALEKIAMRESWKRKKVEGLRSSWVRLGVLLEVRHW
jgi:nitrogen permease regulator 3-like protein